MAKTLVQLQADEFDLQDAVGTGALKVVYGDPPKQVTFRSVAAIREALNHVRREIQKVQGTHKPRLFRFANAKNKDQGWRTR